MTLAHLERSAIASILVSDEFEDGARMIPPREFIAETYGATVRLGLVSVYPRREWTRAAMACAARLGHEGYDLPEGADN